MEASTSTLPPFKLKPLTVVQEDRIIESRLSNDERGIRKTLKNILTLERRSNQSNTEKDVDLDTSLGDNSAAKSKGTLSIEDKNAEAYSVFNIELKNLELHVKKSGIVGKMEAKMRETYAAKGKEIERKQPHHTLEIASLREKLQNAEEQRKQKMEYDDIAQKILAIGRRDDLETAIQERQENLTSLIAQKQTVLRSLRLRSVALGKVLQDLTQVEEVVPESTGAEDDEVDTEALETEKMLDEDAPRGDASDVVSDNGEEQEDDDDDGTGKRRNPERLPSPTTDDIQMVEDVLPYEEPVEDGEPNLNARPSNSGLGPLSPISSALSNPSVSSPGPVANRKFSTTSVDDTEETSPSIPPSASRSESEDGLESSEKTDIAPASPTNSNASATSASSSTIIMTSNSQLQSNKSITSLVDRSAGTDSSNKDGGEDLESAIAQPEEEQPQPLTSSGRPKRRSSAAPADVSLSSGPQTKKSKTRR